MCAACDPLFVHAWTENLTGILCLSRLAVQWECVLECAGVCVIMPFPEGVVLIVQTQLFIIK